MNLTLKQFTDAIKALNKIYGNDAQELSTAIGRFYDNFARR